jgi:hypothetical protein
MALVIGGLSFWEVTHPRFEFKRAGYKGKLEQYAFCPPLIQYPFCPPPLGKFLGHAFYINQQQLEYACRSDNSPQTLISSEDF